MFSLLAPMPSRPQNEILQTEYCRGLTTKIRLGTLAWRSQIWARQRLRAASRGTTVRCDGSSDLKNLAVNGRIDIAAADDAAHGAPAKELRLSEEGTHGERAGRFRLQVC